MKNKNEVEMMNCWEAKEVGTVAVDGLDELVADNGSLGGVGGSAGTRQPRSVLAVTG